MTQQAAYRAVRTAIESGMLRRAEYCARCGARNTPASDGRSTIQAHHYAGYDNPLLVEWLCPSCHRAETPLPAVLGAPAFGEANGQAKLTTEAVMDIRSSDLGCRRLGRKYGVDKRTIQRVRNGVQWLAAAPQSTEGK